MQLPRTVLVPVDFGDYSEAALDYAVALAAMAEAVVRTAPCAVLTLRAKRK